MSRRHIPQEVLDAAHARSAARAAHDWAEADRLRAEIEAAGWKVVDRGTDFALAPAAPPDELDGERVRYGSSAGVPSRLNEGATAVATVVLSATDEPFGLERAIAGIRAWPATGTSIVIVANAPSIEQVSALDRMAESESLEIIWTSARLGPAAAANIGIRRATGSIVVLLDQLIEPRGDIVTPLIHALDDPSVAVAGGWGLVPGVLRAFEPGPTGDVDAVDGACQAFRRADAALRGPLDERFRSAASLGIWWSLVLRDEGEDEPPRRAIRLGGLPLIRHEPEVPGVMAGPPDDRASRRDRYRIIDRFGWRRDLLTSG